MNPTQQSEIDNMADAISAYVNQIKELTAERDSALSQVVVMREALEKISKSGNVRELSGNDDDHTTATGHGNCIRTARAALSPEPPPLLAQMEEWRKDKERLDKLEFLLWSNNPDVGNGLALFPTTKVIDDSKSVCIQGLGDEDGSSLGEEISSGGNIRAAIDSIRAAINQTGKESQ